MRRGGISLQDHQMMVAAPPDMLAISSSILLRKLRPSILSHFTCGHGGEVCHTSAHAHDCP